MRVTHSQQLAAMFRLSDVAVPTATSVITRTEPPVIADDSELGEAIMKQNSALLRNGLQKAGIAPETIEKLKAFENFAPNAGEFLIASLDLSHRMMIYLTVSLLQEAERIKRDYLDDACLDDEYKIQWQNAYNDIVDMVGKAYDRTLVGTQALAKLMGTDKDTKKERKLGFKPLKRVEKRG